MLAAAIVWALFVPLADLLARHDVGSAKPALLQTARDAARGRLLTLLAGLFAAGALVFTALNFNLSRRTFELTEQGQVTERFTKAIEQLGSDKLDVRIGGIYALERIARDSAHDHPTVMEVLTAFIRQHSPIPLRQPMPDGSLGPELPPPRPDVQAAVTVVGRRKNPDERDKRFINLTGADLTGADLTGADLTDADLNRADLADAQLTGALLTRAKLVDARLARADLTRADLTDAVLSSADLIGTVFTDAHLTGAGLNYTILAGADLNRADLYCAELNGAALAGADLTDANLTSAHLTGAHLTFDVYLADPDLTPAKFTTMYLTDADPHITDFTFARLTADFLALLAGLPADAAPDAFPTRTNLTGANLTGALWPTAEPIPGGWMVDEKYRTGRLKRAGQLSEVTDHYFW